MPLSTFKGLPENTEGLKKIALWGNSLISPFTRYPPALSLCWAGEEWGAVQMWSCAHRSSCLVVPQLQSHPWLEFHASVGIGCFACNLAAFFSLPSKDLEDQRGAKGWEEPEARAVNTMTHLWMWFFQSVESFTPLYLQSPRPSHLATKAAFLPRGKSSGGKKQILRCPSKGWIYIFAHGQYYSTE